MPPDHQTAEGYAIRCEKRACRVRAESLVGARYGLDTLVSGWAAD